MGVQRPLISLQKPPFSRPQKRRNPSKETTPNPLEGSKSAETAFSAPLDSLYARARKPRVQHIRKPRFTDPTNNNIVERLNGTVREREKVMLGKKSDDTAEELMNGFRTYYNFIRPHMSLDGQTPAETSGLNLKLGENKWLSLIKRASSST